MTTSTYDGFDAYLRAEYEGGKSILEIAQTVGLTDEAVRRRLHRAGTPLRPRGWSRESRTLDARLRAQYEGGRTVAELGQEHPCSSKEIRRRLKRAGVVLRPKSPNVDPDFLRKEYESGQTLNSLSLALGLSIYAIRRRLIRAGVVLRPTGRRAATAPTEANLALRAAYEAGKTVADLAQERGISRQGVEHHLRRAGALSTDRRLKIPWDLNQCLRAEYESGKTQQELALKWGCSRDTIGYRIRRASGEPPKNRPPR
jgi:DNA-binding CsgD family transcriptional regulator